MAGEEKKMLQTLMVLIGAILVLQLVTTLVVFFFNPANKKEEGTKKVIVEKPELGPVQNLGEFIVNLADPTETHYLRADVVLEMDFGSSLKLLEEVDRRMPQIKDVVLSALGSKTSVQLNDPENREALKQEIKDKINAMLNRGQLARVYFTSFAIQ